MQVTFAETKKNTNINQNVINRDIMPILPRKIQAFLKGLSNAELAAIEEIRLRRDKPLLIKNSEGDYYFTPQGKKTTLTTSAYKTSETEITEILQIVSCGSIYALEQEFKNGYLTIKGGHRIGFAGEAVVEKEQIKTLKKISSLNIRVAREFPGCANTVIPYVINNGKVEHTLIISPPGCGKTTLLRDIVRQLSEGIPRLNFPGITVGVVDERSEIAGCCNGVPQHQVGSRTDVLDKCPKAQGMIMLVRSMSPGVIATDELGGEQDIKACREILNAGITLLATAHGSSLEEVKNRPGLKSLISSGTFKRYVILHRKSGPGKVQDILDSSVNSLLKNSRASLRGDVMW